jgi:hypothetical protein
LESKQITLKEKIEKTREISISTTPILSP